MSKKTIRLTESQLKEYISKVVSEQVINKPQGRLYDKMVIDCLKKEGYKSVDTRGKYFVYLFKNTKGGDCTIQSDAKDPRKFYFNKPTRDDNEFIITPTTNCDDLIYFEAR